jgi:anaerobic ribonucleoside-triphosphate reductase activating protein
MHQLNIAALAGSTHALGPGARAVIWVQGCPLHCRGCIAPEWIPFAPAMVMTPEELLARLDLDQISGITFSGGEPMEQAAGLAAVARLARATKELNFICFTGYRYERLVENPPNEGVPELLAMLDVLIDGPYIQQLNDSLGLRGSSNQRVIHLTSRLQGHDLVGRPRTVEFTIQHGEVRLIGIPTPEMLAALDKAA